MQANQERIERGHAVQEIYRHLQRYTMTGEFVALDNALERLNRLRVHAIAFDPIEQLKLPVYGCDDDRQLPDPECANCIDIARSFVLNPECD